MADQVFAVNSGFYDAVNSDRTYSADDMNRPYKRVVSNGVFATPKGTKSTDLQVVSANQGMQIIVKKGEGIFADKWLENPAAINITVPANTSTVPRIDSVIVQVDKRTSGRVGNIVYRTGTPSVNPVAPSINTVSNVIEYRLANVRVETGTTAITTAMITDRRGSADCPWVTSLIYQVDTSVLYDQWAAAYEEYFETEKEMWDSWYAHLAQDLDVSLSLVPLKNTVVTTSETSEVQIGISDYDSNTDMLEVYINGMRAIEGGQYTINGNTSILLSAPLGIGQTVNFVVLKSVIGGASGSGGVGGFVIPEMFGAVGDGVTDDTQAIQDAIDTGKNVYFGNKTYCTTGITISKYAIFTFENTTLCALELYQDFVVSVTATVDFRGTLNISGKRKSYNGIKIYTAYGSTFDTLVVTECNAWGVNCSYSGQMNFKRVRAGSCGRNISLNVSYVSNSIISNNSAASMSDLDRHCLESEYAVEMYYFDNTGESTPRMVRKITSYHSDTEQFEAPAGGNAFPTTYINKDGYVCYGGALLIGSQCNTQNTFDHVDTMNGSTGITFYANYGHVIGSYYSQSDMLPVAVASYSLGNVFNSISAEASRSGYVFGTYYYDYSVVTVKSTDFDNNFTTSQMFAIMNSHRPHQLPVLAKYKLRQSVPSVYGDNGAVTITEQSPNLTMVGATATINLDLYDTLQGINMYSPFATKCVIFTPNYDLQSNITIQLTSKLIDEGFSIEGGVNGALTFARPSRHFLILITLRNPKAFRIFITSLTLPTNVST